MAVESIPSTGAMVGRASELAVLSEALDLAARSGRGLLLRGDPGVGKSTLLDSVARMADAEGWRVLRSDGTPAEQRLPLAGLHKLLRPLRHEQGRLTRAGQETLAGAFGSAEAASDVFGIAVACLDLLSIAASATPVAVLIDDVHWLDRSTVDVLAFVARRLEADPILLVAASRYRDDQPLVDAGLPVLEVDPLDEAMAATLLDQSSPGMSTATRQSVLETAAGNPLALLELPLALTGVPTPGRPPGHLPLTRRLERGFLGRAQELPRATQDLLLVAALDDSDDVAEVVSAAGALSGRDRDVEDLHSAVIDGLVRVTSSSIVFRHPLVRSAVHQGASAQRRRAAHAALSAVVDHPDRRAWHRASAVTGPDETIAVELDDVALRALRRGSVPGALQALERAAELSGSAAARGRRLLHAADLAAESGRAAAGRSYLDQASPLLADSHDRLRLEAVNEFTDESMRGGAVRVVALIGLAEQARQQGDDELALRFLLRAAMRCWHHSFSSDVERRVVDATDRLQIDDQDPRRQVIYAYASPFERGAEVLDVLARRHPGPDDDPADLLMLGYAGACTGGYQEAELYCTAAADRLREQGRLTLLAEALSLLTWSTLRRNRWQVAVPAAEECVRIARDIRQPVPHAAGLAALAAIAGLRGDDEAAESLAAQAEELATSSGNTIGLAVTCLARGLTAAGRGQPEEAFDQLWHLYAPKDAAHQRMQACRSLGHFAEAAVRTGHVSQARLELARFEALAARTPAAGVHVAMRSARALLAEPDVAEQAFLSALEADWSDWVFEHGRLLLAYGKWLRRHHRIAESRTRLRAALRAFVVSGTDPWAAQVHRELRAAGEARAAPAMPAAEAWHHLSPQETEIARLVIEGLSNKEIAQQLFLSPRTVGSHLYRMFPKLGVTSRTQLARALGTTADPPTDGA